MNPTQSPLERDVASMIVTTLNLETVEPEQIDPSAPLFGAGLGLDSIDALELIVLLQQQYNIKLNNAEDGPKVFQTVRTMADYIKSQQA